MIDNESLLKTAMTAAQRAGEVQRSKYGAQLGVDAKLKYDIKLEADRLCEAAIIETIRKDFPSHSILAEERGAEGGDDYLWIVDPLDGTVNFYYGIPYFCTTIACYRRADAVPGDLGTPLIGVVYAPLANELFTAKRGEGAFLNGKRLAVREDTDMSEALLLTNIPRPSAQKRSDRSLLAERVRKIRSLGAAAYDMANVAAGRASGFFEIGVHAWDYAAGRLLVEEAGGKFTGWEYAPGKWAVAVSGPGIHGELVRELET